MVLLQLPRMEEVVVRQKDRRRPLPMVDLVEEREDIVQILQAVVLQV